MKNDNEKYIIKGGNRLSGTIRPSGAKNVALKTLVAACLTSEPVIIHNVPLISDFFIMADIIKELGGTITIDDHTATIQVKNFSKNIITLDQAAHIRTSSMFMAPLLTRHGQAIIPNPGGCRLGARPIDRTVEGLKAMGAEIDYESEDGYFHATTNGLKGTEYTFEKNTHTGTETLLIAAVLAKGQTLLHNAAAEPEIDELIDLLNKMGAKVKRISQREIVIDGVEQLHGTEFSIAPDRNEVVTFAIAAIATKGDVFVEDVNEEGLKEFIDVLKVVGGGVEIKENGIRFYYDKPLKAVDVTTKPYPGFMTDWQAPWAVLMTQAQGESVILETVFEYRFSYVLQLRKMGAKIDLFNPEVADKKSIYNFNLSDDRPEFFHAARIHGPTQLHDAVVEVSDLRAGASLVVAALLTKGESVVHGVHNIKRGYEDFENRLQKLGANIIKAEDE
ncbi:MAG TPA: UDP-N-acetylglucosamine 1-carboxyvinyltransferase [Patescibacteria group bacterium]|nr:UDP-N-acetylglucosamine 1-carboxyvinyltransferase [Patescibacteria group bacterium]